MTKNNDKTSGGNLFLAGYGLQVLIAPALAGILLAIFFWGFGYDADLLWTNILILAIWLILVLVIFRLQPNGKIWRDYGWMFSPAILILLLLLNISWARSILEIDALDKSGYIEISVPDTNLTLHIIYPQQIVFNEQNAAAVTLWITNDDPCIQRSISLTSDDLFFAFQPTDNSPLQWQENITTRLPSVNSVLLIHVRPRIRNSRNTQVATLDLTINSTEIQGLPPIALEGKKDAQIRSWKNAFLDASSISIVIGIVAAWIEIRRKEEEGRKRKEEEINNALEEFDETMCNNFSASINNWERLTRNWEEWDWVFQDQAQHKFRVFIEGEFWNCIGSRTVDEIAEDIKHLLLICQRLFENQEEKIISALKQLLSALQKDENAPRALLTLLKEYPASIEIAKRIASAFPPDLKRKASADNVSEFPDQIRILRFELDFPDLDSFPLQRQFKFFAKPYTSEERLTGWLKARELDYSPFADADSPFYSVSNKPLLIDAVAPGFTLQLSNLQNTTFEFANSWDAGAALFEYCKSQQSAVKIKEETFFVVIAPSLIEDYGMDQPHKLYLHALAEQWIWSLAETPTLLYSLKDDQRDLVGRLLRWHDLFPSITANKIERRAEHFKTVIKNQTAFSSKIKEWLTMVGSDNLRTEEANALIGLRPLPKQNTLFLISTIDLNPHVEVQISSDLREKLDAQSGWLSAHDCQRAHFQIGNKNRLLVSQDSLVAQCNNRIRICSQNRVDAFNLLFNPHDKEPAEIILARKADGSPGRMVRLGQQLLLQHVEKYPPDDGYSYEYLHIEDLEALQA